MARITAILAFVALFFVAGSAEANYDSSLAGAFTRSYTSAPADADPNTSAPAAANIHSLPKWVYSQGGDRLATGGFLFYIDHDGTGAAASCTVVPWVRDGSSARWLSLASVTGVTVRAGYTNLQVGNADIFFQVSSCGGAVTVNGDHPLVLYSAPR